MLATPRSSERGRFTWKGATDVTKNGLMNGGLLIGVVFLAFSSVRVVNAYWKAGQTSSPETSRARPLQGTPIGVDQVLLDALQKQVYRDPTCRSDLQDDDASITVRATVTEVAGKVKIENPTVVASEGLLGGALTVDCVQRKLSGVVEVPVGQRVLKWPASPSSGARGSATRDVTIVLPGKLRCGQRAAGAQATGKR